MQNSDLETGKVADPLTQREREIMCLVTDGLSNQDIAERMFISVGTVKWYLKQIYGKLHVGSRTQAIAAARSTGLLDGSLSGGRSPAAKHTLPPQLTPFVGREAELAAITLRLEDPNCRLLTLVGPGGIGKTRVALEAAAQCSSVYIHGVHFVELAPISNPENILSALAEALGYQFQQDHRPPKQQLLDYLSEKQMLLVLDNFEHLLAGSEIVAEILQAAPKVKIIATSRERLNLSVETVLLLGGLEFPQHDNSADLLGFSAVELFLQSAQRAQADFVPQADELSDIGHICRLVQGMPLALLLASAWVGMLSLHEIAAEIGQNLDMLTSEMRDMPERQRSIRAVFQHSWNLLSEEQRGAFMRMSVFHAGCTRQAAEGVTGADLRTLTALVSKSLVRRDANSGRYEVHELLRQYAAEQLEAFSDTYAAHNAHCLYYLGVLHDYEADLKGRRQLGALRDIEADFENMSAAWQWAVIHKNYDTLSGALESHYLFCDMCNRFQENEELFGSAARQLAPEGNEEPHEVWGQILARQQIIRTVRPSEKFREQAQKSLVIAQRSGNPVEIAYSLRILGNIAIVADSDYSMAEALSQESLTYTRPLDNRFDTALGLHLLAYAQFYLGQLESGIHVTKRCLELRRQIGDEWGSILEIVNLGIVALFLGIYGEAEDLFEQAGTSLVEIGDRARVSECQILLGLLAVLQGDFEKAKLFTEDVMSLAIMSNHAVNRGIALVVPGLLANIEENYATSLQLCAEGRQLIAVSEMYQAKIAE